MPKGNTKSSSKSSKKEDVAVRLGRRIKTLRTAKGLTQVEMSGLSGLGQAYLSRVESGTKQVSLNSLEAIATALRVTLSDLFKGI